MLVVPIPRFKDNVAVVVGVVLTAKRAWRKSANDMGAVEEKRKKQCNTSPFSINFIQVQIHIHQLLKSHFSCVVVVDDGCWLMRG